MQRQFKMEHENLEELKWKFLTKLNERNTFTEKITKDSIQFSVKVLEPWIQCANVIAIVTSYVFLIYSCFEDYKSFEVPLQSHYCCSMMVSVGETITLYLFLNPDSTAFKDFRNHWTNCRFFPQVTAYLFADI